jgi:hypothetical protein
VFRDVSFKGSRVLKPHCIQSSRVLVPASTSKSTLRRHGMAYVTDAVTLWRCLQQCVLTGLNWLRVHWRHQPWNGCIVALRPKQISLQNLDSEGHRISAVNLIDFVIYNVLSSLTEMNSCFIYQSLYLRGGSRICEEHVCQAATHFQWNILWRWRTNLPPSDWSRPYLEVPTGNWSFEYCFGVCTNTQELK